MYRKISQFLLIVSFFSLSVLAEPVFVGQEDQDISVKMKDFRYRIATYAKCIRKKATEDECRAAAHYVMVDGAIALGSLAVLAGTTVLGIVYGPKLVKKLKSGKAQKPAVEKAQKEIGTVPEFTPDAIITEMKQMDKGVNMAHQIDGKTILISMGDDRGYVIQLNMNHESFAIEDYPSLNKLFETLKGIKNVSLEIVIRDVSLELGKKYIYRDINGQPFELVSWI